MRALLKFRISHENTQGKQSTLEYSNKGVRVEDEIGQCATGMDGARSNSGSGGSGGRRN